MAQQQFTTYQADILSFELREALLGIANPGRYRGYTQIASNGSPSGGLIPITVSHTNGLRKQGKLATTLSNPIGVAITQQGTIIHEDQVVSLNIATNPSGDIRYDILYLEHDYIESVGPNNATYGIIQGTPGEGIPELSEPYHRIIIGLLTVAISATNIAGLSYSPAQAGKNYGDLDLPSIIWGDDLNTFYDNDATGIIPVEGIIGNRSYTESIYIYDNESITKSIDRLDMALFDEFGARVSLGQRAIDDSNWGLLADVTTQNVSTARHGLMPKLSNVASQFLNGLGNWVENTGRRFVWRDQAVTTDFAKIDFGEFAATSGYLDLSSLVPADCDLVMLRMNIDSVTAAASVYINLNFRKAPNVGAAQSLNLPASGAGSSTSGQDSFLIGLAEDKTIYWTTNVNAADHVALVRIVLVAWQTAT